MYIHNIYTFTPQRKTKNILNLKTFYMGNPIMQGKKYLTGNMIGPQNFNVHGAIPYMGTS
jgi:hypothetical protein